jgi:hypothetical protein
LAWAFVATNKVDRSPAYRLAFPFDTEAKPYSIYNNNINSTYTATPAGEGEIEGMSVLKFNAVLAKPAPVTPAYFAAINKITPLPTALTLTQLKPILLSAGVDVDKLTAALLPHLTKPDLTTLVALMQQKVKLVYLYGFTGSDSVEPSTGSIVDLHDDETVYATPDPAVLPKLTGILAKYKTVPAAVQAVTGLTKLAANPIKVFENNFKQTDASIADIASTVKHKKDQKHLAESTIPDGLRYGGIAAFAVGVLLIIIPKRRKPSTGDFSGPITIATDPDSVMGPGGGAPGR